jgi:hypothetical protein
MTEVATTVASKVEERAPAANEGYWGWKENLKGSLSSLSLSGLGKSAKKQEEQADTVATTVAAKVEESLSGLDKSAKKQEEQADTVATTVASKVEERAPAANEGYWGWKENLKGSLSSLSLSGLGKSAKKQEEQANPTDQEQDPTEEETPKEVSYWEWKETLKKTLSTLSLTNMGTTVVKNEKVEEKPDPKNYWTWKNFSKSASNLENKEQTEGKEGGYWGWTESLKGSLSTLSLSGLGKSAGKSVDESPESPTKTSESVDVPTKTGPISNLDHKMRSSWRSSFQRLSSNTLSKLDEDAEPKATWKDNFRSFRDSVHHLNTHGGNNNASLEEDLEVVPASFDKQVENRFTRSDSIESEDDGITF